MNSNLTAFASGIVGAIIGGALVSRFSQPAQRNNDMQFISTTGASPAGGHYSQAVVANGVVTISGLLPITPEGNKLADKSFAEQVACVLANLDAILQASGSSRNKIVNCSEFLLGVLLSVLCVVRVVRVCVVSIVR